jgi:hypothetical protein
MMPEKIFDELFGSLTGLKYKVMASVRVHGLYGRHGDNAEYIYGKALATPPVTRSSAIAATTTITATCSNSI